MEGLDSKPESRKGSRSEWGTEASSEDLVNSARDLRVCPKGNSKPSMSFR